MPTLFTNIRDFFSTSGALVRRSCNDILTPFMREHGFDREEEDIDSNVGSVTYRRGEQWLRAGISKHPSDDPGLADVYIGVGSSNWPEREEVEVSLDEYIAAKTIGKSTVNGEAKVAAIVSAMRYDIEKFAQDFLSGDLRNYQSALARKGRR